MTGETGMSVAVAGRKRQTVHTARRLAECSRKWRLRQETSDGRLLTDDGMCSCSVNDNRRRRRPGRLDTGTSWFRYGGAIRFTTVLSYNRYTHGRRQWCTIAIGTVTLGRWPTSTWRGVISFSLWLLPSKAECTYRHVCCMVLGWILGL